MVFSRMDTLAFAVLALVVSGLFVKMSNGATYAVVPFVNRNALGAVTGIVGAGGNVGAVAAGFLFRSASLSTQDAFLIVGLCVALVSSMSFFARFAEPADAHWRHAPAGPKVAMLQREALDAEGAN